MQVSRAGFPFFNMYRCLVVLRGKKIIADATTRGSQPASLPARIAMAAFSPLFHLNIDSSPWGWQMVGTARAAISNQRDGYELASPIISKGESR